VNRGSIGFHQRMGFEVKLGDGDEPVRFVKRLAA
jgi:hypothetical protein